MSRELRRVPLDFKHPLNQVWPGFVCNEGGPCPETNKTCFNGASAAGAWLESLCRIFAMVASESMVPQAQRDHWAVTRERTYPHPYLVELAQAPRYRPTASFDHQPLVPLSPAFGEFMMKLTGDKRVGDVFSDGGSHALYKALLKLAKVEKGWDSCPVCGGSGDDPATRAAAEAWTRTPPPTGDGWQVWESVTEGSPISPVFKTAVQLQGWLVKQGYTKTAAAAFTEVGWVPSGTAVVEDGKVVRLQSDIETLDP